MTFNEDGFILVKSLITKDEAIKLAIDIENNQNNPNLEDLQVPNTPAFYNHFYVNKKQSEIMSKIEEYSGSKLLKTYTYCRLYKKGDTLKIHKDRVECEISLTLDLGGDEWPIYIMDKNDKTLKFNLEPGDALIYKGCERPHWREAFEGEKHPQVFMHFVDANGPYKNLKGDPTR